MESALIVSSSDKSKDSIAEILKMSTFSKIITVSSGSEARRTLIENTFDLVVINSPLHDEFGHELSITISENTSSGVIIIVKSDKSDEVGAKVEDFGVFLIEKPISRQFFYQALKLINTSRRRLIGLESENSKLQNKIEEIKLVDRAKCVLIQYLNMTEHQAHRYIEKQSMDRRISKKEVSQGILKTYES